MIEIIIIKYIITWGILQTTMIPCPQNKTPDEFGRLPDPTTMTLALCTKTDTLTGYSKEFTDRDSALAFYKRALMEQVKYIYYGSDSFYMPDLYHSPLINVKIDNVMLWKWTPTELLPLKEENNAPSAGDSILVPRGTDTTFYLRRFGPTKEVYERYLEILKELKERYMN